MRIEGTLCSPNSMEQMIVCVFCYEIKLVVCTKNQILLDDTMFSVCPMCQATVCSLRFILLIALHRPINE